MEYQSNRLCILTKIRNIIGNNSAEGKVEQALLASKRNPQQDALIFCAEDGESITREFWQTEYRHAGHSHTRAFVFDAKIKWEFRDDGELRHFAVGAILWRQEKDARRYCLFRRRTHPIGCFTIPAGHLEMGESPKAAAQREAFEETQMSILSIELFYEGEINEECRRAASLR
jgi:NADH pyrophosphatase NudC (nudix superfamily)